MDFNCGPQPKYRAKAPYGDSRLGPRVGSNHPFNLNFHPLLIEEL